MSGSTQAASEQVEIPVKAKKIHRTEMWALEKPFNIERLVVFLQRVTGLGILFYLAFHIIVTGNAANGKAVWTGIMETLSSPLTHLGEVIVVGAVVFHGVNGIRVILMELTKLTGKPVRPDYPYNNPSLNRLQRGLIWMAIGIGLVVALYASSVIFGGE